jgi:hypothetical protein
VHHLLDCYCCLQAPAQPSVGLRVVLHCAALLRRIMYDRTCKLWQLLDTLVPDLPRPAPLRTVTAVQGDVRPCVRVLAARTAHPSVCPCTAIDMQSDVRLHVQVLQLLITLVPDLPCPALICTVTAVQGDVRPRMLRRVMNEFSQQQLLTLAFAPALPWLCRVMYDCTCKFGSCSPPSL